MATTQGRMTSAAHVKLGVEPAFWLLAWIPPMNLMPPKGVGMVTASNWFEEAEVPGDHGEGWG